MEDSILLSTKKILGIDASYVIFDQDILTHINAAFSVLDQLGVGPVGGFFIIDEAALWSDLNSVVPANQLNLMKTYIYLKVRMLFDPPTTSFLIEAMNKQLAEFEWRLNMFREDELIPSFEEPILVIDGGEI
jgi:hypothetical protein